MKDIHEILKGIKRQCREHAAYENKTLEDWVRWVLESHINDNRRKLNVDVSIWWHPDWWERFKKVAGPGMTGDYARKLIHSKLVELGYEPSPYELWSEKPKRKRNKARDPKKKISAHITMPRDWHALILKHFGYGSVGHVIKLWLKPHLEEGYKTPLTPLRKHTFRRDK